MAAGTSTYTEPCSIGYPAGTSARGKKEALAGRHTCPPCSVGARAAAMRNKGAGRRGRDAEGIRVAAPAVSPGVKRARPEGAGREGRQQPDERTATYGAAKRWPDIKKHWPQRHEQGRPLKIRQSEAAAALKRSPAARRPAQAREIISGGWPDGCPCAVGIAQRRRM